MLLVAAGDVGLGAWGAAGRAKRTAQFDPNPRLPAYALATRYALLRPAHEINGLEAK